MPHRYHRLLALALIGAACAAPPSRVPPPAPTPTIGVEPDQRVFVPKKPPAPPIAREPRVTAKPIIPAPQEPDEAPASPPPAEELLAEAWHRGAEQDVVGAAEIYRQVIGWGGPEADRAKLLLAAILETQGRMEDVLETLGELKSTSPAEAWRLRARALETLGRRAEAVWAYVRASGLSDEIETAELSARVRYLIDGMTTESLSAFAASCPFCPEGGYARLRLARNDIAAGRLAPAETALLELETDFVGDPLGPVVAKLRDELVSRRSVQPGLYGLLLPLSGPLRLFGAGALRGALLGSGLFSDEGNRSIRFAVADSRGDPARAAEAVEELARRGVVGIVGPLKGSVAVEAARVAATMGIPLVALTPAAEVTREQAFRLYLREEDEVTRLVEYATEIRGMRRFAILYPDTPLGMRYRNLFWDAVIQRGGEITGVEALSPAAGKPGEAIQRLTGLYGLTPEEIRERFLEEERIHLRRERELLAALEIEDDGELKIDEARLAEYKPKPTVDFDAVFLPVSSLEAAQIAPQFPFQDVEGVALLGIRSWNYEALIEVGEEYVEGAIFPAELHPEHPAARRFFTAYRGAYGDAPGVIEAYAFDAVGLFVRNSSGFEDETRATLRRRLRSLWDVDGATGPLTIHPGGDIAATPKILVVRRGRILPAQ